MVKSYRGVEVDMDKLIQQQGDNVSLGNTNLNGRGDEIKHGKVVKTRAERLKEYLENHPAKQEARVDISKDGTKEPELNIETPAEPKRQKAKAKEQTIVETIEETTSND